MKRIRRRYFWAEGKQVYQGMSMFEDNQRVHVEWGGGVMSTENKVEEYGRGQSHSTRKLFPFEDSFLSVGHHGGWKKYWSKHFLRDHISGLLSQFCYQQRSGAESKSLSLSVPQFPSVVSENLARDYLERSLQIKNPFFFKWASFYKNWVKGLTLPLWFCASYFFWVF